MSLFDKREIDEILNNSHIGLWKLELEDNMPTRLYADKVTDALLGIEGDVSPEDRYTYHRRHIHPDDKDLFEAYATNLQQGQSEIVYRYLHPRKGEMYVRCAGSIDLSIKGFRCCKGIHQDISNSMRYEKDSITEYRLTRQLDIIKSLSLMFTCVYYIDLKDYSYIELYSMQQPVHQLIGRAGDKKHALDMMVNQIVMPKYIDGMKEFLDFSTANERLKNKNCVFYQYESKYRRWIEAIIIAAHRNEHGDCDHVILAMRDIEELKQKELAQQKALMKATAAAEAANQAKTKFLFNMSHDIRTPMNAIMGFTALMKDSIDDREKSLTYLKKISRSSDLLLSMLNEVLEMSRIESGKVIVTEKICHPEKFINTLNTVFENQMKLKGIDFKISCDIVNRTVMADTAKIREVVLNIVSNAYKYTPSGGKITVAMEELPSYKENHALIQLIVKDTGIGMSKEFLPHIFEEFSRERSVTESKIEGSGLGMPIVKKLVDLMDGSISIKSELGKGTEFILLFYHRIPDGEEKIEADTTKNTVPLFKGKRVLMAEDNELNAEIATMILENYGFTVDVAEDGVICLEKLSEVTGNYYDLILMDIQMPNMNGYTATRKIRQLPDEEKANIPIIAVTANAFDEDKINAFAAGMNEHVAKPINVDELMQKISMALGIHR